MSLYSNVIKKKPKQKEKDLSPKPTLKSQEFANNLLGAFFLWPQPHYKPRDWPTAQSQNAKVGVRVGFSPSSSSDPLMVIIPRYNLIRGYRCVLLRLKISDLFLKGFYLRTRGTKWEKQSCLRWELSEARSQAFNPDPPRGQLELNSLVYLRCLPGLH